MKKLILFAFLLIPGALFAAPVKYVQISTGPSTTLQPGTTAGFWVSSGTVNNFTASTATVANLIVSSVNATFVGWGRNRIVNGAMRIDQRNEGTVSISSAAGSATYAVDHFFSNSNMARYTRTRLSTATLSDFTNHVEIKITSATVNTSSMTHAFGQSIEGTWLTDYQYGTANAKTLTLSFWVRSSSAGVFSGSFSNSAANRSYPFLYTINSVTNWEYKSIVIPGDTTGTWLTTTGIGIRLRFDLGSGSTFRGTANAWAASNLVGATGTSSLTEVLGSSWNVTGVQLEVGSSPTAFEYRPESIELLNCQRYYEKSYTVGVSSPATATNVNLTYCAGIAQGAAVVQCGVQYFKTPKRTIPTMILYSNLGGASGTWEWRSTAGTGTKRASITTVIDYGFVPEQDVNNTDLFGVGHWTADADF